MSSQEPRQSSRGGETRVFLENLPKDVRKDEIDKEFSMYGRIAKVYLIYDPPGSGFVEYFDSGDAEFAASSMNGADFLGSKLRTQLTRGGVPRGRGPQRGGYSNRGGRGFSNSYGDRDGGYSMGGGGRGGGGGFRGGQRGFERGRGRGGDSFRGSRGFGGSRGSYSKGFSGGGDRGFSRGGGGRSFSRGEGSNRGFSTRFNSEGGGGGGYRGGSRYDDGDMGQNGYDKYDRFNKYDNKFSGRSYDKHDSGYPKYPSSDKYQSYGGASRKDSYPRSRSPLDMSPEGYRSSSPGFQRHRSRSPYGRAVRDSYHSRTYEESPKSVSPGAREVFRRPRSKSSRNYSSDHAAEPSSHYGQKEYISSSYGSRRSPMDERY